MLLRSRLQTESKQEMRKFSLISDAAGGDLPKHDPPNVGTVLEIFSVFHSGLLVFYRCFYFYDSKQPVVDDLL